MDEISPEIRQMGSLLSRMTADSEEIKLTDSQVTAVVEALIPRIVTSLPGMPPGMKCDVKPDDAGWTIRVERPS